MMVDIYKDINPRHIKVSRCEDNFKFELEKFELEEVVYPKVGESFVEHLTHKKENDEDMVFCPRCNVVFD